MVIKFSKKQAVEEIEEFFKDVKSKTPKEIKKVKRLAMSKNIPLGSKRKLFCGKCFSPDLKVVGIKKSFKKVECRGCGRVGKWKL